MTETESNANRVSKMLDPDTWGKNTQYIMERFLDTASVDTAYGEPVEHGEYLVIPTAEVLSVAGYGVGLGGGYDAADEVEKEPNLGGGGGGGGGGKVLSRPVAVVVAGPNGVRVEPIIDITKLWIAALTAVGFMVGTFFRMRSYKRAYKAMKNLARETHNQ